VALPSLMFFKFDSSPPAGCTRNDRCPRVNFATAARLGEPDPGYEWPVRDAVTEKRSFLTQVALYFNHSSQPDVAGLQDVMEELYTKARWKVAEDPFSVGRIVDYIENRMNLDASPGYPWCKYYQTNRKLLAELGSERLAWLVRKHIVWLLGGNRCFPVRLFIKAEWHKRSKIVQNRQRLIWSVSLLDQIVDELLFGPSMEAELKHYESIPSKPGLSEFNNGMGVVFDQIEPENEHHSFIETDKSAWDMTVPAWLFSQEMAARRRLCLNPGDVNGVFWKLWDVRVGQLMCSDVVFTDGTMLEQVTPGIVRSGSKTTISANSRMQVMLKVLYCLRHGGFDRSKHMIVAMGDDTIERVDDLNVAGYVEWLRQFGFHVKEVPTVLRTLIGANFCGRTFIRYPGVVSVVFKPAYWLKNRQCVIHADVADVVAMLGSYCQLYAFDDEHFGLLYDLLLALDVDGTYTRSRAYFQGAIVGHDVGYVAPSIEFDDSRSAQ
jgi:hypothetical protein